MSIGRNEVLHVARLAELAVGEGELDRLVDQMNRIVDYVAQLDQVPADPHGRPVPAGTGVRRASRGRSGPGAARPPAGGVRARVPRRLLPGAAPWCHGGGVSGAATAAKETGGPPGRRRAAERDAPLVAGPARRRGGTGGCGGHRRRRWPRRRSRSRTISSPSSSRRPAPPGSWRAMFALQRHRREPLAGGRGDDRGARPTWTSSRWARPPSTRRSGG